MSAIRSFARVHAAYLEKNASRMREKKAEGRRARKTAHAAAKRRPRQFSVDDKALCINGVCGRHGPAGSKSCCLRIPVGLGTPLAANPTDTATCPPAGVKRIALSALIRPPHDHTYGKRVSWVAGGAPRHLKKGARSGRVGRRAMRHGAWPRPRSLRSPCTDERLHEARQHVGLQEQRWWQ